MEYKWIYRPLLKRPRTSPLRESFSVRKSVKVRVARAGMGKRGGARVIYIWRNDKFPVFLVTVFPKNEKENLSKSERNALKKRADDIFRSYFRR
jgi:hypothetical protein